MYCTMSYLFFYLCCFKWKSTQPHVTILGILPLLYRFYVSNRFVFSKKPPEAILFENYLMMVFSLPLSCNLRSEQSQLTNIKDLLVFVSLCLSYMFRWIPLIIHFQLSLLLSSDIFWLTAIAPPVRLLMSFLWNLPFWPAVSEQLHALIPSFSSHFVFLCSFTLDSNYRHLSCHCYFSFTLF